jgi:hypothetical protein
MAGIAVKIIFPNSKLIDFTEAIESGRVLW